MEDGFCLFIPLNVLPRRYNEQPRGRQDLPVPCGARHQERMAKHLYEVLYKTGAMKVKQVGVIYLETTLRSKYM